MTKLMAGKRGLIMGLANSLMLDFRCWIVPRFVYVTGADVRMMSKAAHDKLGDDGFAELGNDKD